MIKEHKLKKKTGSIPSVTDDQLSELSEVLRLMGEASRLKIIIACLQSPICVSDIIEQTGLSQSLVSHHLRLLKATGLLKAKRTGRQIFYAVSGDYVRCILVDLIRHVTKPEKMEE